MESANGPHVAPFVNVTNGREAHPKSWVAILVQMNTEKKVSEKLTKLGIENYVPVQSEIRQWSDRKKRIDRIVIPMVVFVHIDKIQEHNLKTYSYVYKFLTYPGQKEAAIIPVEQIERLKFMLKYADTKVEMNGNPYSVGEVVKISRGPLKGLEGVLCYVMEQKPMVAIRIESLGYACVSVPKSDIEMVQN